LVPEEQALLKELRDDKDRRAFEEIFWARRDPTPGTAANELEASIRAAWSRADELFAYPNQKGSETGCGQVLALLGPPEEVLGLETRTRFDNLQYLREGDRRAETWVYRDRPSRAFRFTNAELRVAFDPECRFAEGGRLADDLERAATALVSRPEVAYARAPTATWYRLPHPPGLRGRRDRPAERAALRLPARGRSEAGAARPKGEALVAGLARWPSAPASERASLAVRAADASGQPLGTGGPRHRPGAASGRIGRRVLEPPLKPAATSSPVAASCRTAAKVERPRSTSRCRTSAARRSRPARSSPTRTSRPPRRPTRATRGRRCGSARASSVRASATSSSRRTR
jgi:GWxTD domain-containing protein